MQFLQDFSVLDNLVVYHVDNVESLSSLPNASLPALKNLAIVDCTALQNVTFPDLTPARLAQLVLNENHLDDATVNEI